MEEREFGAAGERVVLEECLVGPEMSFFAICDGTRAVPMLAAQDHKRVFDDDKGPEHRRDGRVCAEAALDAMLQARVMREIVEPVVRGMSADGHGVSRVPLRRADADVRRSEGDRVQPTLW